MTEPRHVRDVTAPAAAPAGPAAPRLETAGPPTTPLAALLGPVADVLDLAADAVPALAVVTARGIRRLGLVGVRRSGRMRPAAEVRVRLAGPPPRGPGGRTEP